MNRKCVVGAAIMVSLVLGTASLASAVIEQIGKPDPLTGFPMWYRDLRRGVVASRLALCLDPTNCDFDPPIPGNPVSVKSGFGRRAWYYLASATLRNGTVVIGKVQFGMGATYSGAVTAANRMTDNLILIQLDNLPVSGTYTVQHPFGQQVMQVFVNSFTGRRSASFLKRTGGKNFTVAMNGPVGRFLIAAAPRPPLGFIGNPWVLQTVRRSPVGHNFVKIIGPPGANLGGTVLPNEVMQTRFKVMGQEF